MAFTADQIKRQLQRIITILRPIAEWTDTNLDNKFVEVLQAIEASDELLALVVRYYGGDAQPDLATCSDDAAIDWPRVRVQLPKLFRVLRDLETLTETGE